MRILKQYTGIIVLIVLSYFTVNHLFIAGFFPMHDDTQPSRVFEMSKALKDGMFPVRLAADLGYGYGYPIFNFYAPAAYYIGSVINLTGLDALLATKMMMGIAVVSAGVSMYLLAKEFWGKSGGLISGLLYLYAPYHALDLYVRGDVAELYAYSFIPLVFLSLYKVFTVVADNLNIKYQKLNTQLKDKKLWVWFTVGSLSYAAVITSHNLSALMTTPFFLLTIFLAVYYFFNNKVTMKQLNSVASQLTLVTKTMIPLVLPLMIGILLSAFYWLPALTEMQYTNVLSQIGGEADYSLHFVCPLQLWDSPWGFGGSVPGCQDGMSYRIGKLHLLLSLTALFLVPYYFRKEKRIGYIVVMAIFLFGISVWLTTLYSKFIWDSIPLMKYLQYPWRFLLPVSFFSSLVGGSVVSGIKLLFKKYKYYEYTNIFVVTLLTLLILFLYSKLYIPQTINRKTVEDYTSEQALKWNISKISDEYLPQYFNIPDDINDIVYNDFSVISGRAAVSVKESKTHEISAIVSAQSPTLVNIKKAYFPAWNLYINNRRQKYEITPKGLLVNIPPGRSHLLLRFEQTLTERMANILSLIGILVLGIGIIKTGVYEKKYSRNRRAGLQ